MSLVKGKLNVKSLDQKCLLGFERHRKSSSSNKDVGEEYDVPCYEAKFYWDWKCIKYFAELLSLSRSWKRYAKKLLQRFESLHVHDALENNSASWLILIDNKIPITVKILIYFLSRIAFKTYESQYRSKYSVRFTQLCVEGKNF